jgi:ferredoxin
MKIIKIEKEAWVQGLEKLQSGFRLFGPAADKDSFEFKELAQGQLPVLDIANTRLSAKSTVYPKSQVMFDYTLDESKEDHHIMKEVETEGQPRAVIGLRPCDAASFLLVKRNFDNPEYPDPFWIKPFEQTTFVGFACDEPSSTCFCTSVSGGPYNEAGIDVLLSQEGEGYLAKILTDKGSALAKAASWETEAGSGVFDERKEQAEQKISSKVSTDQLKKISANDLFKSDIWEDISFSCMNCGTCTYSCPTCWCFDIQEEVKGTEGKRMRNWDSCMYPLFTLEGSGHNPRPNKEQRVRQRFMHKLKYYLDKYESDVQCVGCGRCIDLCPVNIDIRNVCEIMNNYKPLNSES